MRLSAWSPVMFVLFASLFELVQAQGPTAQLRQRPLAEIFEDEVPVSGRVVAGAALMGPGTVRRLALVPPASAASRVVCVQVLSRDGRYSSKNSFELPATIGSTSVDLEYPSKHEAYLTELEADELAVLARAGACDDSGTRELIPATAAGDGNPTLRLFVNSGRAKTHVSVSNDHGLRKPKPCREIEQGRRTGFDTICDLDLTSLSGPQNRLEVRILRRQYERMLPPTVFTVLMP